MPIASLIFLFVISMLVLRLIKCWKRSCKPSEAASQKDSAYNALTMTTRILDVKEGQGEENSTARRLLADARREYAAGNYGVVAEYCASARGSLSPNKTSPARKGGTRIEETGLGGVTETSAQKSAKTINDISCNWDETPESQTVNEKKDEISEDHNSTILKNLERDAMEALEKRNEQLPAKFTIQVARDAIEAGKKEGRDMTDAEECLLQAVQSYERKAYPAALSMANRAKKMALGEEMAPLQKPAQMPEPADEEDTCCFETFVESILCGSCGEVVEEDALFCRHCGARLIQEISCGKCGAAIPGDSRFCPKCGTPL